MAGPGGKSGPLQARLRLDKWLWQARFFKTRDLASEVVTEGHLRLNGQHCRKPGHGIGPGDVLTFAQGETIRVIKVLDLGQRRGPASEAETLYLDLDPRDDGASHLE
ncbi:RNA-binding S4 domain-containing protein [Rhodobacter sp. KR11]|uniref:RNA-binding S4 domain-containing protein n=1 Tax=Rhodobacter sp. KR11 TaxID=2974588 RepID=UPI0039B5BC45